MGRLKDQEEQRTGSSERQWVDVFRTCCTSERQQLSALAKGGAEKR